MVALIKRASAAQPWADGAALKKAVDAAVLSLLGPKTEADSVKQAKPKKAAGPPAAAATADAAAPTQTDAPPADPFAFFPAPEDNKKVHTTVPMSDGSVMRIANTPAQLAAHLATTGGRVVTRFPPEPNGCVRE